MPRIKPSILNKVLLSILGASIISVIIVVSIFMWMESLSLEKNLIQENIRLAEIASKNIEVGYFTHIWPFEMLKRISQSEDILFWWVVKPDGEIHLADDPNFFGKIIDDPSVSTKTPVVKDSIFLKTKEEIKLIAYPIMIGEVEKPWTFYLGVSKKPIIAAQKKIVFSNIVLLLIIALFASFLSFFLAKTITNPIRKLRNAAIKISKGEFVKAEIESKDEIGELSTTFNEMTGALKESLEKEKELSRIKDQFIKTASHQLRTPLSITKWSLEVLRKAKKIPPKAVDAIEDAYQGSKKLITIVNDLLAVSEFGLGYYKKVGARPIDLGEITDNVIDGFKTEIKEKRIKFQFKKPPEPLKIEGTIRAVRQVIWNLVDNAITYTKPEGKVEVNLKRINNEAEFSVKDTGIGIPKEEQKDVFSEFFRASNSVEQKSVGTGLGLFITKNIIEGHGGKIWFESEEGKGSAFYFSLPLTIEK